MNTDRMPTDINKFKAWLAHKTRQAIIQPGSISPATIHDKQFKHELLTGKWGLLNTFVVNSGNLINEANMRAIRQKLDSENAAYTVVSFKHFVVNWIEYTLIDLTGDSGALLAQDILSALNDYPIYDEDLHSDMQCEAIAENARDMMRYADYDDYILHVLPDEGDPAYDAIYAAIRSKLEDENHWLDKLEVRDIQNNTLNDILESELNVSRQYANMEVIRELMEPVGYPYTDNYVWVIAANTGKWCLVKETDIKYGVYYDPDHYGTDVLSLPI